jgi:pSer/pThr/pTyr-binding forkhead associated (FHA) protein
MTIWILKATKTPGTSGNPEKPETVWTPEAAGSPETPDDTSLTFRLGSGAIKTIGRGGRADFIVDRSLVSRLHCRLTAGDEILEVQDLASTNGTFVNGKRVLRAQIAGGDRLRVGRIELTVEREAAETAERAEKL